MLVVSAALLSRRRPAGTHFKQRRTIQGVCREREPRVCLEYLREAFERVSHYESL